jgi:hypothetical protein
MAHSIAPVDVVSKGRMPRSWTEHFAALRREAMYWGDVFLGHDAERIAAHAGLSRREINRLRESGCHEAAERADGDQRLTPVEKVTRVLHAAIDLGLPHERCTALVRPILDALNHSETAAPRVGLDRALELLIRECAEAQAELVAARPGGISPFERGKVIKALREARIAIDRMETEILSVGEAKS